MHEISVARSLVDFVRQEMEGADPPTGKGRVKRVRIRLGALCGLTAHALKSAYRAAVAGTSLQGCELEIEPVELVVWCTQCQTQRQLEDIRHLRCPVCQTRTPQVVQGREMEIDSIEVVDGTEDPASPPEHPEEKR